MLIGLGIRDFVLVDSLDLAFAPGLTALTGETGAGKSIILGALGMALGGRCDATVVRRGAAQAVATAIFAPSPGDPAWAYLGEKGLAYARDEDLVLRRTLSADGRSRAFVNDQPVGAAALRDLAALLVEIHGQHETVGLLDPRTHRGLLDGFGGLAGQGDACLNAWTGWRDAATSLKALLANRDRAAQETEEVAHRLTELDRLSPRDGEEATLAAERRLLSAADKAIADLARAREQLDDDVVLGRLGQARRAVQRARETVIRTLGDEAGSAGVDAAPGRMAAAAEAIERACVEAAEAAAALDAAAQAFRFEPARLDQAEERLFALRAMARKLGVEVDALPEERARLARRLVGLETAGGALAAAEVEARAAEAGYKVSARALSAARRAAGAELAARVSAELEPLKLEKARFRVSVEPLPEERAGPAGADKVEFEIATLAGAPFAGLAAIASGGELARLALALKVCLAARGKESPPLMIFDEVDQGVGGAVADAVGQRLARLAEGGQVIVITHSPQVAARADAHWRVSRAGEGEGQRTRVEVLKGGQRQEEIARMLAGATITDAARAAARALMDA